MPDNITPELSLVQPEEGFSDNTWGAKTNANWTVLDDALSGTTGHRHTGVLGDAPPLGGAGLGMAGPGFAAAVSPDTIVARLLQSGPGVLVSDELGLNGSPVFSLNTVTLPQRTEVVVDGDQFVIEDVSDGNKTKRSTRTEALRGSLLISPRFKVVNNGFGAGAVSLDLSAGSWHIRQLTGASTLSFLNPPAVEGFGFILELINPGFGTTFPATVKWPGGAPPPLTAAGTDIFVFLTRDGGATWRGALVQQDSR